MKDILHLIFDYIKNNKFLSLIGVFLIGIIQNIIANISTPGSSKVIVWWSKIQDFIIEIINFKFSITIGQILSFIVILSFTSLLLLLLVPKSRIIINDLFYGVESKLNKESDSKENTEINNLLNNKRILFLSFLLLIIPVGFYGIYKFFKNKANTSTSTDLVNGDKVNFNKNILIYYYLLNQCYSKKSIYNYNSDKFYEIKWYWKWIKENNNLSINNLVPVCPKCNYELKKSDYIKPEKNHSNFEDEKTQIFIESLHEIAVTINQKPYSFICEDCGFKKKYNFDVSKIENKVKKKIWKQVRNKNLRTITDLY